MGITKEYESFAQFYHDLWHALFNPAPRIAQLVEQQMGSLGLAPVQHISTHLRALYAVQVTSRGSSFVLGPKCGAMRHVSTRTAPIDPLIRGGGFSYETEGLGRR